MSTAPAQLLFAEVMHRRLFPVRYRFAYRVVSLLIDPERAGEAAARSALLSHNRFNLFSFHDADHGPRDGSPLRPWLQGELRRLGLDIVPARIELLCFPRVLGYGFNPLSVWFCYSGADDLVAVLCEVRNTFGEKHGYLLHHGGRPMPWPVRERRHKRFHVSPFIGMDAEYHFRFSRRDDELALVIREFEDDDLMLVAVQRGRLAPLGTRQLLRAAVAAPLLGFKVMAMIHWQALRIWLKGAPFFSKPPAPGEEISG